MNILAMTTPMTLMMTIMAVPVLACFFVNDSSNHIGNDNDHDKNKSNDNNNDKAGYPGKGGKGKGGGKEK